MEKREFRYADKVQQLIRSNRFMALAVTAYYLYIAMLLTASVVRGERSIGFCGLIGGMVAVMLLITWAMYLKNKKSAKMRYFVVIGQ